MDKQDMNKGIMLGILAYIIWGLLPLYWKALDNVGSDVVFAQRIIWSFVFIFLFILLTNRMKSFLSELKRIFNHKKILFSIIIASLVIGVNWLVFIWAVQHNFVVQVSLGYYINPLMSVLFGVILLKERLSGMQQLSVLLAFVGVLYLTMTYKVFPWVSLILAISFAIYGLFKKIANLNSTFSLMIETAILTPAALIYLLYQFGGSLGFVTSTATNALLLSTGIASAVPLLLFGVAVLHMPLSLTGFLQYIAPTIMLFIGVILYKEPFTINHLVTFLLIWTSIILYVSSTFKRQKAEG